MKIVYISRLVGTGTNGLCWSVPASVKAQSAIDDVYWLNLGPDVMDHWRALPVFHSTSSCSLSLLTLLPKNYKKPDIVVFEGVYDSFLFVLWGMELKKNNIPYIIVPRSALTEMAMNNHARYKKKIAHYLFYNRFIGNASALHLLTKGEAEQTHILFKRPYFIIPNGVDLPLSSKSVFNSEGITASFIGRIDIHQKGLDLLIKSIAKKKELLTSSKFHLNIYGPERKDTKLLKELCFQYAVDDIVTIKKPVLGEEKRIVLLNSDVFILTSRFEGLPMGLIEALSYGLPCAVTYGTFMGQEIINAYAGWVSDFSVEGIASMLELICEQQKSFGSIGKNARLLSKKYDWNVIANKTHEDYQKVTCINL